MFSNSLQRAFIGLPAFSLIILSLPSSFIRYALYPIPALLVLHAAINPPTEETPVDDSYLYGLFGSTLALRFFDYLYWHGYDTPKHIYRVTRIGKVDACQEYPQHTLSRIKWALLLTISTRGIGWNIEVPLPETKWAVSRSQFVRRSVVIILQIYLCLYLIAVWCDYMVRVLRNEVSVEQYPWVYGLFRNDVFQMIVVLVGWSLSIVSHVSMMYNYAAIICVGLGIGGSWKHITSWPNTFGEIRDAWSIRNVWGKVWHQNNRRCLTAPGENIGDRVFGDPSKLSHSLRLLRRYFLLFSAFFWSGILHAGGVYFVEVTKPMPYEDSTPPSTRPPWYATGYFFYVQAVAITLEDFFCWALTLTSADEEVRKQPIRRYFGYFYTFTWFIWTTTVLWIHPELAAFGYQRLSDEGRGYIHILEATTKATSVMPFNPWPVIVDAGLRLWRE